MSFVPVDGPEHDPLRPRRSSVPTSRRGRYESNETVISMIVFRTTDADDALGMAKPINLVESAGSKQSSPLPRRCCSADTPLWLWLVKLNYVSCRVDELFDGTLDVLTFLL
jgi:hypothetical protein